MFNEVVEKDIAQLKEYLKKHEAHQGSEDSDPKKIIENMMEHLKNTEIKCANDNDEEDDKQQPPQYDLKCNHFVEIHKYLLNWLNFMANREEIDKQGYFLGEYSRIYDSLKMGFHFIKWHIKRFI